MIWVIELSKKNTGLECPIQRFCPPDTVAVFSYTNIRITIDGEARLTMNGQPRNLQMMQAGLVSDFGGDIA